MDANVGTLFDQAMKLSPLDREDLAARLFGSLNAEPAPQLDPAWDAEIARQAEEIRSGEGQGFAAEDVFRRMRSRFGEGTLGSS